jgi:nucleotide-binding universal stress UspA family protein
MRKNLLSILGAGAFVCAAMAVPVAARADHAMSAAAERAEERAKDFADRFDAELDKLVIDGFYEEERLEELSEKLRSRLDEVHDVVKDAEDAEAKEKLEEALGIARQINEAMAEYAFSPKLKEMWGALRADLSSMAAHFGLAGLPLMRSSL